MKFGILGGGSGGISMAIHLAEKAEVDVWEINSNRVDLINKGTHDLLNQAELHEKINASTDIEEVLENSDVNLIAVPSHAVAETCKKIKGKVEEDSILVCF